MQPKRKHSIADVLLAYRWYCYLSIGLSGLIALLATAGFVLGQYAPIKPEPATQLKNLSLFLFVISAGMIYFSLRVLKLPRNRTTYGAHLTNIAVGISTCVLAPFCIWLLLEWLKPEVKSYFESPEDSALEPAKTRPAKFDL